MKKILILVLFCSVIATAATASTYSSSPVINGKGLPPPPPPSGKHAF